MFNILLIVGHGENTSGGFDPGAVGNGFQEHERMVALVEQLKDRIINAEVEVLDTRWSWSNRIKNGIVPDFGEYDYVVELHMNASSDPNTNGSMIYIDQSETGHSVEDAILKHLYEVGYKKAWDGVVVTQRQFPGGLIVQNAVRRAGVSHALIETCFITNKEDIDRFNTMLAQTAQAIADGIIEGWGLDRIVEDDIEPEIPNYFYVGKGFATGIAKQSMNVRKEPVVKDGNKEGILYTGQAVEILETTPNGFLKIVWPGSIDGHAYVSNVGGVYFQIITQ